MNVHAEQEQHQYLTFTLNRELFALPVGRVREILDAPRLTRVPRSAAHIAGVINLRGRVVPVIALRQRLGIDSAAPSGRCVVVVEAAVDGEKISIGALVDSVQEVLPLPPEQIDPAPRHGLGLQTDFLVGLGKRGDGFVTILAADEVLGQARAVG